MSMAKQTILSVRTEIAAVNVKLAANAQAPRDPAIVAAALRTTVSTAAARFSESISAEFRSASLHGYSLADALMFRTGTRHGAPAVDMAGALGAILGVDTVCSLMQPYIDALAPGIASEQRASTHAELTAELHRLEHVEEDLIEASEAAGMPIARRGSASPCVVLRVKGQDHAV